MTKQILIQQTQAFIKKHFEQESSGHDWWHIHRVRQLSLKIGNAEKADLFLIEMAALLHDLDDWKINGHGYESCPKAQHWLNQLKIEDETRQQIVSIIKQVSFKGAGVSTKPDNLEAQVVQDADRLDAIGAIGIARAFAYGGNRNRMIFDPETKPAFHDSFEAYRTNNSSTINHFYEKLFLLKDLMNTATGKVLAQKRHQYMEYFLQQFFDEWKLNA